MLWSWKQWKILWKNCQKKHFCQKKFFEKTKFGHNFFSRNFLKFLSSDIFWRLCEKQCFLHLEHIWSIGHSMQHLARLNNNCDVTVATSSMTDIIFQWLESFLLSLCTGCNPCFAQTHIIGKPFKNKCIQLKVHHSLWDRNSITYCVIHEWPWPQNDLELEMTLTLMIILIP